MKNESGSVVLLPCLLVAALGMAGMSFLMTAANAEDGSYQRARAQVDLQSIRNTAVDTIDCQETLRQCANPDTAELMARGGGKLFPSNLSDDGSEAAGWKVDVVCVNDENNAAVLKGVSIKAIPINPWLKRATRYLKKFQRDPNVPVVDPTEEEWTRVLDENEVLCLDCTAEAASGFAAPFPIGLCRDAY